jgi:hypothetical protein
MKFIYGGGAVSVLVMMLLPAISFAGNVFDDALPYIAPGIAIQKKAVESTGADQAAKKAAKRTIQTVIETAQANFQQSLAIANHLSQMDVDAAMNDVGKLVVEGECLGCKDAIKGVAGDAGLATVEQMVSTGFIVLTRDPGSPMFLTYDAVAKHALASQPEPTPPAPSQGESKPFATFDVSTEAECIVASSVNEGVTVGFSDLPVLQNRATKATGTVLKLGLHAGDHLSVKTADGGAPCPAESVAKNHQVSLKSADLVFLKDATPPRVGQKIVYLIAGKKKT